MSIIQEAGLTDDEARAFVSQWTRVPIELWCTAASAAATKIAMLLRSQLPIVVGERVTIPLTRDEFRVLAIDGDDVWVLDLVQGGRLTVKLDCIERLPS